MIHPTGKFWADSFWNTCTFATIQKIPNKKNWPITMTLAISSAWDRTFFTEQTKRHTNQKSNGCDCQENFTNQKPNQSNSVTIGNSNERPDEFQSELAHFASIIPGTKQIPSSQNKNKLGKQDGQNISSVISDQTIKKKNQQGNVRIRKWKHLQRK